MTQRIANLIRRYPFIIRLPYLLYRRFQTRYTIGVVGVLFNEVGHILIVEHVFHPEHPWGLPGGWIGRDEQPALAILRELEEELKLKANIQQILHIDKRFKNHIDIAFLCEASNEIGDLSFELLGYKWIEPEKLPPLNTFHEKAIEIAIQSNQRS